MQSNMSGRLPGNKIGNHVIAVLIALAVVLMLLIFYWLASRCDTCEVGWHSTVASSSKKELSSSSDSTEMAAPAVRVTIQRQSLHVAALQ
jgi:hypothetical protein